jgi:hypothetical protein
MPIQKSRAANQTEHNTTAADPARSIPVVGIGASAGGLQAFAAIFRHCRTLLKVIAGMVVTFEDISKLKEPVDTLTECKSLWRGLIETAPMGHSS